MNSELKESDFLNLVNDIDFERIDLGLRAVNIFDILKVTRAEIRHSNFLGWLLNPVEGHGLNEIVLVRFLRTIFSDSRASLINGLEADSLDFRKVEIRREWQSIDLLLIVDDVVICIENKFDSIEHSNQLKRYYDIVSSNFPSQRKVFVFLTPLAQSAENDSDRYIEYSYQQIAEMLERILLVYGETLSEKVSSYIRDYIQVLKRTIMQTDELNVLAEKLYKNHRATLDFIFENRPDLQKEIQELLVKVLLEKGFSLGSTSKAYVRFLTPELMKVSQSHNISNGWGNREAFLFEININVTDKFLRLVFKTVVSPGDMPIRDVYQEVMSKVEGASQPYGQKWLVHFISHKKFGKEKFSDLSLVEKNDELEKFIDSVIPTINLVNEHLLSDERINPNK